MIEEVVISGVTSDRDQAKISLHGVPDTPGIAAIVFQEIADANINIDMIIQNTGQDETTDISFTVAEADLDATLKIAEGFKERVGCP